MSSIVQEVSFSDDEVTSFEYVRSDLESPEPISESDGEMELAPSELTSSVGDTDPVEAETAKVEKTPTPMPAGTSNSESNAPEAKVEEELAPEMSSESPSHVQPPPAATPILDPLFPNLPGNWRLVSHHSTTLLASSSRISSPLINFQVTPAGYILITEYSSEGEVQRSRTVHPNKALEPGVYDEIVNDRWFTHRSASTGISSRSEKWMSDGQLKVKFLSREVSLINVYEKVPKMVPKAEAQRTIPILEEISGCWKVVSILNPCCKDCLPTADAKYQVGHRLTIRATSDWVLTTYFFKNGWKMIDYELAKFEGTADYIENNQWITITNANMDGTRQKSVKRLENGKLFIDVEATNGKKFTVVHERTHYVEVYALPAALCILTFIFGILLVIFLQILWGMFRFFV